MIQSKAVADRTYGVLVQLSYNMWLEADAPLDPTGRDRNARAELWFDESLWREVTQRMADAGLNMVVLDLGDGVQYQSHPEIAVKNAWSTQRLREEAQRLQEMGLELIPKLNFSAGHDVWLGPYSRCVSTPTYYQVCRDLIAEVSELLNKPRLFHLGMETAGHQRNCNYIVIRQFDLFWHDLLFLCQVVEDEGVRPWIWSDYIWYHQDEFLERMPKSIMQSNWYYHAQFSRQDDERSGTREPLEMYRNAYQTLESHGYDQIPTCSNVLGRENTARTIQFAREHIAPERLKGFL